MINNSTNSKLDEAVKTTLNNYEAPYDAGDWARMENMLNAAPKSSSFNWTKTLSIGAVAVAVIGGSYFLYNSISSAPQKTVTTPAITPVEKVQPQPKTPAPIPATINTTPAATSTPVATETNNTSVDTKPEPNVAATKTENKIPEKETKTVVLKETTKAETKKSGKEKNNTTKQTPVVEINHGVLGMGNEPVFGDMLDSSKGIIGETREKEETKKAAKANKSMPPGWNSFMTPNVNPDSLKKYRERRDSAKVQ